MFKVAMIAVGGAVGATLRYALSGYGQKLTNGSFPLGTLIVNLIGCFLIGFLGTILTGPYLIREEYRTGLLVGTLGAFTTFSTFGWETFALSNANQIRLAVFNILLNNGGGLISVWSGYRLGERWLGV